MSNSKRLIDLISERVNFISKIFLFPGEMEQEALCFGALSVLKGEEQAKIY
jgi:butyrate kinase